MKEKSNNDFWTGKIERQESSNIIFNDLTVRKAKVIESVFKNCQFNNCTLGSSSNYINCEFDTCIFTGKFSAMGESKGKLTKYVNCSFKNCTLIGSEILNGTIFIDCEFSGKFKNIILRDTKSKLKNFGTIFQKCNLENVIFENIHVYGNNVFQDSLLPSANIYLYDNDNDKLLKRAIEIFSHVESENKIDSETIFNKSIRSGQNPIILDDYFLKTFFSSEGSRKLFEEIVEGYCISK